MEFWMQTPVFIQQNQQSIPSLFARKESEESTFVCPLCLKTFSESDIQSIHTKNCAAKNNISTKKLLAAVELQEKQGKERKAIGLPSKPIQAAPKKRLNTRKLMPDGDPDIQLALALSMSLKEVEQIEFFNEGIALAAETDEKILEMSSSQRKSTLQSFGFSSNKIAEPVVEKRRRKLNGPTVLQSRTREVREQILTDKIAEVLVGSESITQQQLEACKPVREIIKGKRSLRNRELKEFINETADLWSRSIFCFGRKYYYVEELNQFFKPFCEEEGEEKEEKEHEDDGKEEKRHEDDNEEEKVQEDDEKEEKNQKEDDKKEEISEEDDKKEEKEHEDDKKEEINQEEDDKPPKNPLNPQNKDLPNNQEIEKNQGIISLSNDWSQMVASSYLSDVAIFVKDSSFIHAHNLVFWTRCHSLTNDYEICDSEDKNDRKCYPIRNKIDWSHIDHTAALGFLRYVYCGQISDGDIDDQNVFEQIKSLGKKYKIKELIDYLEKRENGALMSGIESSVGSPIIRQENSLLDGSIEEENDFIEEEMKKNEEIIENKSLKSLNYGINTSADLFEDSEIIDLSQGSPGCSPGHMEVEKSLDATEESLVTDSIILNKQKSDLSRFIDKIERQQARDILESDTDGETPVKVPKITRKNPFKIGERRNDYSDDWGEEEINEINIQEENDKRTALSILEDEIRARTGKNVPVIEEEKKCEDDKTEIDDDTLDESMYTRYMKSCKENSIEDYRNCLKYANVTQRNFSKRRNEIITQKNETTPQINETTPQSFNISEDLNFDTWEEISEPSNSQSLAKNPKEDILVKPAHTLSDEDDDFFLETDFSSEMNINHSPRVKSPSPIVLSSEDEEISNERRPMEIFSQVLSPRASPAVEDDDSDISQEINTNNYDNTHDFEDKREGIDEEMIKTPLKNSQLPHKHPQTPENPLKRPRTSSSLQISYDITPPMNYNRMKSPELIEELNKYGLKPQKRPRAIQLLEHIYNELHPLVPVDSLPPETSELLENENYEPVCKKRHFSPKKRIIQEDIDEDDEVGGIIPEEMDFYQEDYGGNGQGESICVREAFDQLLKSDNELYVKVLSYEPLPLEDICERLKGEGFRGKVNDVMSFLDDQCITFQVQQQRNNRKGKKR